MLLIGNNPMCKFRNIIFFTNEASEQCSDGKQIIIHKSMKDHLISCKCKKTVKRIMKCAHDLSLQFLLF